MKCKMMQQKINLYFDNQLTDEEKEIMLHHISQCDACNAVYHAEKTAVQLLNQTSMKKAPKGFTDDVMKAIGEQSHSNKLQITDQHTIAILSRSLIAAGVVFCFLDVSAFYEKLTFFSTIDLYSKMDWIQNIYDVLNFFR